MPTCGISARAATCPLTCIAMVAWIEGGCVGTKLDGVGPSRDTAAPAPHAVELHGCSHAHTAALAIGGQTLSVKVDTGSTTLAVSAAGCISCERAGVTELYDTTHGVDRGLAVSTTYGTGSSGWVGEVYQDAVDLGPGLEAVPDFVAVSDQTSLFGIRYCDTEGEYTHIDGILGLGPAQLLVEGTSSYLTGMAAGAVLPESIAIRLCHEGGTLWFGGYDASQLTGDMQWTSLRSVWGDDIGVTGLEVLQSDGVRTAIPVSEERESLPALLDSGFMGMSLPSAAYSRVTSAIDGDPAFTALGDAGWWDGEGTTLTTSPAEIDAALPRLLVDVAGSELLQLSLPATESYVQWLYTEDHGAYQYVPNLFDSADYPNLPSDFLDLGNLPMYSYVTYIDRENMQVGFAPAVPCEDEE